MKHIHFLFVVSVIIILSNTLVSQTTQQKSGEFFPRSKTPDKIAPSQNPEHKPWNPNVVKRPGRYTKKDWRDLIDSVWGPGLPTADKLQVFDFFWNTIDQTWGGFANLEVNWDSLKTVYRAEVAAGVSRGRFAGILGRLTIALQEHHAKM